MLIAALGQYFFGITIFITSMFLIMLVLVQRGRGGGLAGALGGPGGQSAFGTKAGDLFTRITIGVAAVWIFLCAAAVVSLKAKKFTTDVTRTESGAGSMGGVGGSGAGDDIGSGTTTPGTGTPGTGTPDTGSGLDSPLPNASTPGLELTPPASTPAATTPAAETPAETTAPADTGTEAEVSELSPTDSATDAPTDPAGDLPLDDPAGIEPPAQP
jgi:preprotein translocase subunit SecG